MDGVYIVCVSHRSGFIEGIERKKGGRLVKVERIEKRMKSEEGKIRKR